MSFLKLSFFSFFPNFFAIRHSINDFSPKKKKKESGVKKGHFYTFVSLSHAGFSVNRPLYTQILSLPVNLLWHIKLCSFLGHCTLWPSSAYETLLNDKMHLPHAVIFIKHHSSAQHRIMTPDPLTSQNCRKSAIGHVIQPAQRDFPACESSKPRDHASVTTVSTEREDYWGGWRGMNGI